MQPLRPIFILFVAIILIGTITASGFTKSLELEALKARAEYGDTDAQFLLGTTYFKGNDVPQDYNEAMKWFRKAGERGHTKAQYNLGVMYSNGDGVPQDYKESARWYRKAAEQGHTVAEFNLGTSYAHGRGVPQDYVQAHMWFNLSAANGNKEAAKIRDKIAAKMLPQQIAEAQRLATARFNKKRP